MKYRTLGNTGIQVSEIAMGSEGLEGQSYEVCRALIETCLEQGINFFDLYNPNPETRRNFGKAMAGRRQAYVLQGHLCTVWQNGQYLRTRDIDSVRQSFESLLNDLGTDYIDVGMIHYADKKEDFETILSGPVLAYAKDLKARGVIKSIGLSTHSAEVAFMAVESGAIEVIMFSLNPAYDMRPGADIIEDLYELKNYEDNALSGMDEQRERLYQTCAAKGIAITVMKPYGGGMLLDAKKSPFEVALTPLQCLHYALTRPAVSAVMAGCFTPEQIREAARYETCSDEEKDFSVTLSSAPRHSYSGRCMYCGHCAPCTVGIDIALVNKYLDLAHSGSKDFIPETVREHYALLEHPASECISCGVCETNCPFGVAIIEKMAEAADVFGC
ncbi:MAG TPA: aldo/keto reductase [Anaerolineaceae bacterium]|nr:aldo/keto reductase [Anaerolineaceae bacterium]HPN51875.1 aldo/keto reductase [Anaerolineaceae bacterium]